ncbi:hypothetical protein [Thiomicrorhabdus indica]|uniref:hypothetical protein n=1 Tax=Thiomicrorhabdus indica TaxID=2267253 RepID=UPI00102D7F7C|nr:hypothetical protein [Thiomicrorhabdus indica]
MAKKISKKIEVTPALKYFFAKLEKENSRYESELERIEEESLLPIDEIEAFVRALKTQNIFIHTVGLSGKRESTILSKAIFSLNKIIKIYYSTSFDEHDTGFIRVRSDLEERTIVVERLHGFRPKAETMYQSSDQCHVIRYLTKWLIQRIDWTKTKLSTLEIYSIYQAVIEEERQEELFEEDNWMEHENVH